MDTPELFSSHRTRTFKNTRSKVSKKVPKQILPLMESLEPRLLLSADTFLLTLPPQSGIVVDLYGDGHEDFRYLTDPNGLTEISQEMQKEFSINVSGDLSSIGGSVDSVEFRLAGLTEYGFNGEGGGDWDVIFDMRQIISNDDLEVIIHGPSGSESFEAYDLDITLLPDWFIDEPVPMDGEFNVGGTTIYYGDFVKFGGTTINSIDWSWTDGYTFDIEYDLVFAGFEAPDDWVWEIPFTDITALDLSGAKTGMTAYTHFSLNSPATISEGQLLTAENLAAGVMFELLHKGEGEDEIGSILFDYEFDDFSLSGTAFSIKNENGEDATEEDPLELIPGFVDIWGNIKYEISLGINFTADDLEFNSIYGEFAFFPEFGLNVTFFEAFFPLLSIPGGLDVTASASFGLGLSGAGDLPMLSITPAWDGEFYLQSFEFNPEITGELAGTIGLRAVGGLGEISGKVKGDITQGFTAEYQRPTIESEGNWVDFTAPGTLTMDIYGIWTTFWGLGPSGEFHLLHLDLGEWDLLRGDEGDVESKDIMANSPFVINPWVSPVPGEDESLTFRIEYNNPGNPPTTLDNGEIAAMLILDVDNSPEYYMELLSGYPDNGIYQITIPGLASQNIENVSFVFFDQDGNYHSSRISSDTIQIPTTNSEFKLSYYQQKALEEAQQKAKEMAEQDYPDAIDIEITLNEGTENYGPFKIEYVGDSGSYEEVFAEMSASANFLATITIEVEEEQLVGYDFFGNPIYETVIVEKEIEKEYSTSGTFTREKIFIDPLLQYINVIGTSYDDDISIIGVSADAQVFGDVGSDTVYLASITGNALIYGEEGNDILYGGSSTDVIWGGPGDDQIHGLGGNDEIHGESGIDIIWGDSGEDVIYGGADGDTINGGTGADYIEGGSGADTIDGGDDSDTIYGGNDGDTIDGGGARDYLFGEAGADTINGESGNDYIDGGTEGDIITGGTGEDLIYGRAGADIIDGGDDSDTIYGGDDGDTIYGGGARDYIYGEASGDTIDGEAGNDYIEGGMGDDIIHGGTGDDYIEGGDGSDTIYGDDGTDTIYGQADGDIIHGGDASDYLYGQGGSDTINGNAGNDYIEGNEGDDTIHGNAGDDEIYGGTGADTIYGDSGNDTIEGNDDDDTIYGNSGNDVIEGNDGDDIIIGNAGQDLIYGHRGNDILIGDDGSVGDSSATASGSGDADTIYGQEGEDKILGGGGNDHLYGDATGGSDSSLKRDIIIGDGGTITYGNKFSFASVNQITADSSSGGNDTIQGNGGDDIILAGAGGDQDVQGNSGNDIILGDNGTINLSGGALSDISTKGQSVGGADRLWGDSGNDGNDIIIGGPGGDDIYGEEDSDILIGDNGAVNGSVIESTVEGSDGADYIYGDQGEDKILGGGLGDNLYGNTERDILIGDGGKITYSGSKFDFDDVTKIESISTTGGDDTIEGNDGTDIALGGAANDTIYGQADNDILLGDNGTIDMAASTIQSVVNACDGVDTIYGQVGEDKILGGGNGDNLYGDKNAVGEDTSLKRDVIIGDGGIITYSGNRFEFDDVTNITNSGQTQGGNDTIEGSEGNDIVLGGAGGDTSDQLDPGDDVILGDNGTVVLDNGQLVNVSTVGEDVGGADTVKGGTGNDIIIAGPNGSSDDIQGNDGQDIILGDNGLVRFDFDGNLDTLDEIESALDGIGSGDTLSGNADEDIIIGGYGGDTIYGDDEAGDAESGDGADILLGDNGKVFLQGEEDGVFETFNSAVDEVVTTDESEASGGGDTINGNLDNDIILGGLNNGATDTIKGNTGDDVILGDNGLVDFDNGDGDLTTVDLIQSQDFHLGGHDVIDGNEDNDIAIGGTADDIIDGNSGADVLIGDQGEVVYENGLVTKITSTDTQESDGAIDTISGGSEDDVIIGGVAGDILDGNDGNDVILGDEGELRYNIASASGGDDNPVTLDVINTHTPDLGGQDTISGNAGDDIAMGGMQDDTIYGDDAIASAGASDGKDILLGDNGEVILKGNEDGVLTSFGSAVELISTTDTTEDTGGTDTIEGNADSDVILGGVHGDTLYGDRSSPTAESIANDGDDVILGDNGYLDFDAGDSDLTTLDTVASNLDELGGVDTISGNAGNDVAIGGTAGDLIYGDDATASAADADGQDILLGDNGQIELDGKNGQMHILGSAVKTIQTTDEEIATGGMDTISGNATGDYIAGGVMGDLIHGDADIPDIHDGNDHILGDNGRFEWGYQGDEEFADIESEMVFDLSLDTLDLVTTELPDDQPGGRDTIYGDDRSDIIFGGTNSDLLYGDDSDELGDNGNNDLIFGDHGRLYPQHSSIPDFNSENFFAIDTGDNDGGEGDRMYGEEGDDVMLGQQGDDCMFGGSDNDDMIGGHNVSGGIDELSTPAVDATVNPAINDIMDGGTGSDVMLGDNAVIWRIENPKSPRFRALNGTLMYKMYEEYGDYESEYGKPDVTEQSQTEPGGLVGRYIEVLDHDAELQNKDGIAPREFGDDYIAGNADNDVLFGQLGNDVLQGDGSIEETEDESAVLSYEITIADSGTPDSSETLYMTINESITDGDDYIEGNGGSDEIYGDLGQDDIIGGSSSLFGLIDPYQRPDTGDILFGGASSRVMRNEVLIDMNSGDIDILERHSRDSDVLVGDNANIFRIVGTDGEDSGGYLEFNYDVTSERFDDTRAGQRIIPRAVELLDHNPGIGDIDDITGDGIVDENDNGGVPHGQADTIHGESGDDFIHGMIGDDILYGDSEDDDIYGEAGNDWISGGTGDDGILGDDGLIFTSRNTAKSNQKDISLAEPLYGVEKLDDVDLYIDTPGDIQQSVINIEEMLKKSVDLTPFDLGGDDIIYGGLGSDFLHGGAGDDAISGAEALEESAALWFDEEEGAMDPSRTDGEVKIFDYYNPFNPGNILGFEAFKADEFALYDEYEALKKIIVNDEYEFLLNFESYDVVSATYISLSDHELADNDVIFGDLGNDWLVGGMGQDRLYGGYGADLLNIDDNLETSEGANTSPDGEEPLDQEYNTGVNYYLRNINPDLTRGADTAYGGAGRDILINNTGADRLIDWVGEYNSYIVPYAPFGQFSVSRSLQPHLRDYLYDLSESDGADQSRSFDTGTDVDRNGEPEGELGLVLQKDPDWNDQTGAPDDPQAGNIPGGKRDVMEADDFNSGSAELFAVESGTWSVTRGQYLGQATKGSYAISLFYVDDQLPNYYEILATIKASKDKAGYNSNGYIIFDYYSDTDFKFAGIDVGTDKLQIGQRTADGWIVETQTNMQLRDGTSYNLMIAVNGTNVTLVVNSSTTLSYTFVPRVIDGYSVGLNTGMLGIGTNNAVTRFDNVAVQKLPPVFTANISEDFCDGPANDFNEVSGSWTATGGSYQGNGFGGTAISILQLDASLSSFVEFESTVMTEDFGGLIFDYYNENDFKFAAILQETDQIVIGHRTAKGWFYDAVVDMKIRSGVDYTLGLSLHGNSVSVTLNSQTVLGYTYNSLLVDGDLGLLSVDTITDFDDLLVKYQI